MKATNESGSLRELIADQPALIAKIVENEGVLTLDVEQALQALVHKVDSCDMFLKRLDSEIELFKTRAEFFRRVSDILENKKEWFQNYIKMTMIQNEITELRGDEIRFTLQNNPPSVHIENEERLDTKYKVEKIVVSIDKKKIADTLKRGVEVPGASLRYSQRLVTKANTSAEKKVPRTIEITVARPEPSGLGGYIVRFGKYRASRLDAIPRGELLGYMRWLEREAKNRPLEGDIKIFVEKAKEYLSLIKNIENL